MWTPEGSVLRHICMVTYGSPPKPYPVNEVAIKAVNSRHAEMARLTCTCAQYQRALLYPWCTHVAHVIQCELDAKGDTSTIEPLPVVEVPVFLTPPLAVPVLVMRGTIPNTFAVTLNGEHLGFILLGQGRRSLRQLVIEWLVEKSADLPECTTKHHHIPLPWRTLGHFDIRNKTHLVNLADLILTGQCRPCNEDSGVPTNA